MATSARRLHTFGYISWTCLQMATLARRVKMATGIDRYTVQMTISTSHVQEAT
jgi:hypothetical protein